MGKVKNRIELRDKEFERVHTCNAPETGEHMEDVIIKWNGKVYTWHDSELNGEDEGDVYIYVESSVIEV